MNTRLGGVSPTSPYRSWKFAGAVAALLLLRNPVSLGAAQIEQEAPASQETRAVPMVAERWAGTPTPPPWSIRKARPIFQLPGFKEAKERANRLSRQFRQTHPSSVPAANHADEIEGLLAPSPAVTFDGPSESDTPFIPPDPQIAAGPAHLVVAVNSLLAIYDKAGKKQGSFQTFADFFAGLGIAGEIFDPRIIYDRSDGHFILTAGEVDGTNFTNGNVFVAVSQTSDPTGVWYKYAIDFMGRDRSNTANTFPDFPTLGLSSSAIYVSTGQFVLNFSCLRDDSCAFSDTWIKVIGLPELLSGNSSLNVTTFTSVTTASGIPAFAIEPALTYGTTSDEFLVAADFSGPVSKTLDVFSINTSGTPTLKTTSLQVPPYTMPPDAAQPNADTPIATNDFRLLNAVWSNNTLWCAQDIADTESSNPVAGWYEIAASSLSTVSLLQSGAISGVGNAYFPAVSVDSSANAQVVFTTSSSTEFASAAYTGRAGSSDPLNTMRTFVLYKAGTAPYVDRDVRWGDYSGISLDPGGASFWMIAEYAGTPDPHFGTSITQALEPPPLTISPPSFFFGDVDVGSTSGGETFTATNNSSNTVTVSSVTISGMNPGDFAIISDNCSSSTLGAGASCTFSANFSPTAQGLRNATIMMVSASSGGLSRFSSHRVEW